MLRKGSCDESRQTGLDDDKVNESELDIVVPSLPDTRNGDEVIRMG